MSPHETPPGPEPETIAVGGDHVGYPLKDLLRELLEERGHPVKDFGVHEPRRVDYPEVASAVARAVARGEAQRGVLVCGTGVGMCITANKVRGVRAAVCSEPYSARMARAHNDANVLAMGSRVVGGELAREILEAWLDTPFEGGRHARRVRQISALEEEVEGDEGA